MKERGKAREKAIEMRGGRKRENIGSYDRALLVSSEKNDDERRTLSDGNAVITARQTVRNSTCNNVKRNRSCAAISVLPR